MRGGRAEGRGRKEGRVGGKKSRPEERQFSKPPQRGDLKFYVKTHPRRSRFYFTSILTLSKTSERRIPPLVVWSRIGPKHNRPHTTKGGGKNSPKATPTMLFPLHGLALRPARCSGKHRAQNHLWQSATGITLVMANDGPV